MEQFALYWITMSRGGDLAASSAAVEALTTTIEPQTVSVGSGMAASATIATSSTAPAARTQATDAHDADFIGKKEIVTIECAKTGRAACKCCCESIQGGALRCGMEAYAGGRTVMQWAHAECFAERICAEYVTARRGQCKASKEPFAIGDVRIGCDIGGSKSWFSVSAAQLWSHRLANEMGKEITMVAGLEELDLEHRQSLIKRLNGGADTTPLRRVLAATARAKTNTKLPSAASVAAMTRTDSADTLEGDNERADTADDVSAGDLSSATATPAATASTVPLEHSTAIFSEVSAADVSDSDVEVEYAPE